MKFHKFHKVNKVWTTLQTSHDSHDSWTSFFLDFFEVNFFMYLNLFIPSPFYNSILGVKKQPNFGQLNTMKYSDSTCAFIMPLFLSIFFLLFIFLYKNWFKQANFLLCFTQSGGIINAQVLYVYFVGIHIF